MIKQANNYGPTLEQRLKNPTQLHFELIDRIFSTLRVSAVATVVSFDPDTATVTVQLATTELVQQNSASNSATSGSSAISMSTDAVAIPVLTDVPVSWPNGGGFNLTFPIEAGDECIVIFQDTAIDAWFEQGAAENPVNQISQRRHSLSDAIAVFGPRSQPNVLDNWSTTSAQLRSDDGTVVIDIADGQITITATGGTVEVNADTVNVNASQATVNTSGDAKVIAGGDADVEAGASATVSGRNVNITGSAQVVIGSNTTVDSRIFLNHTHSGVQTGGGISGPVV